MLQKLKEENFDVGIGENYDHCAAAIFHRIGVRVQVTAYAVQLLHWIARKYDIPTFASYVPSLMKNKYFWLYSSLCVQSTFMRPMTVYASNKQKIRFFLVLQSWGVVPKHFFMFGT